MKRLGAVVSASVVAACAAATPETKPVIQPEIPPAAAVAVNAPPVVETPVEVPVGKPGWKSVPEEQHGFWLALDGLCSQVGMARVGSDIVVHYGGGAEHMYMNQMDRVGAASFIAMRPTKLEAIGDPGIRSPVGIAGRSLDDFWVADSTGTRMSSGSTLHRHKDGAWLAYPRDETQIHPWLDGGVVGTKGFVLMGGDDIWIDGSKTEPPKALSLGYMAPRIAAFPSGDIFLFVRGKGGNITTGPLHVRHWSPTTQVTDESLAPIFGDASAELLVETAPDEVYVTVGENVALWDGTTWKAFGTSASKQPVVFAARAARNELWIRTRAGDLERSTSSGFVALPTPEAIYAIDGMNVGDIWASGVSGKLYHRVADAWTEVPLPLPAFSNGPAPMKAKSLVVVAPGDVVVHAEYWEKGLGWTEQELHHTIFRSKKQDETLRCNEPDPENNNIGIGRGFQSWPPFADAACTTPFVVITRRSQQHPPTPKDWDKIQSALKGHADLFADGKLIEFVSGDRTFLGGKAKDFESGKQIALLAAAKNRIRPEVLCAEPPAATKETPVE